MYFDSWSVYAGATADQILHQLTEQIYRLTDDERDLELVTSLSRRHGEYMEALDKHLETKDYVCGTK